MPTAAAADGVYSNFLSKYEWNLALLLAFSPGRTEIPPRPSGAGPPHLRCEGVISCEGPQGNARTLSGGFVPRRLEGGFAPSSTLSFLLSSFLLLLTHSVLQFFRNQKWLSQLCQNGMIEVKYPQLEKPCEEKRHEDIV